MCKYTLFDRSMIKLLDPVVVIIFYELKFALNRIKHVLFSCPIQVNISFLLTRVVNCFLIKTLVCWMILVCEGLYIEDTLFAKIKMNNFLSKL